MVTNGKTASNGINVNNTDKLYSLSTHAHKWAYQDRDEQPFSSLLMLCRTRTEVPIQSYS